MTEFSSRILIAFLVAGVVGIALVNMVVDHRALGEGGRDLPWWSSVVLDVAVPVQKMVAVPFDFARDTWQDYVALVDVNHENHELRRQLARAREENLQLKEALVASGRLERIAEMRDEFEIPMLPAELVGVDVSAWFRSALIDRGRAHGVRAGMPVISDQGLVGLVTATANDGAKIMMLIDRQAAVDGVVQRTRARGIARGARQDGLTFRFSAREGDVRVGDTIITSGLGGVYPKGLRIGEVVSVGGSDPLQLQTAEIRPAVDFGRLEQVFVMLRRGRTMELLYATGAGDAAEGAERATP
ncbi:MAG: rod shape-determining protein MreC [Myxococcota bacterium]